MSWLRIFARYFVWLAKLSGELRLAPYQRSLWSSEIEQMKKKLRPGDVLLTFSRGEFTNLLIPGFWKHAAIYDGDGFVIEAVGMGVRSVPIDYFCASKDDLVVLRANFLELQEALKAVEMAKAMVGHPYDFLFEPGENSFYCAELIAYAFNLALKGASPFVTRRIMGVETVLPEDFWKAHKKFYVVWEAR